MRLRDDNLKAQTATEIGTSDDRRRAGRVDLSPELIPIVRGQFGRDLPADPDIPVPRASRIDGEYVSGALLVLALLMVGVALRFIV